MEEAWEHHRGGGEHTALQSTRVVQLHLFDHSVGQITRVCQRRFAFNMAAADLRPAALPPLPPV